MRSSLFSLFMVTDVFISSDLLSEGWVMQEIDRLLSTRFNVSSHTPIKGSSAYQIIADTQCTIVLVGENTALNQQMDREIYETLRLKNGLLALLKPGISPGHSSVPPRLVDNLDAGSGYAKWCMFPKSSDLLMYMINIAYHSDKKKIRNSRNLMKSSTS